MKQSQIMQQVIEKIARQHGFDLLAGDGSSINLENDPYMTLSICAYRKNVVAVNHQRKDYYGDIEYDPEVQFRVLPHFTKENGKQWCPVSIEQPVMQIMGRQIGGYQVAVEIEDGDLKRINTKRQADIATFSNQWARNIKDQGFADPENVTIKIYK